jgi:DNA-directed RNA polymerase specialized sigma subunit
MTNVKNGTEGFSILEFLENEDDDDDEDDIIDIIRRSKNKIKIPTLDDLLEKIYDQGLETLTEEEQQILKTYIK